MSETKIDPSFCRKRSQARTQYFNELAQHERIQDSEEDVFIISMFNATIDLVISQHSEAG